SSDLADRFDCRSANAPIAHDPARERTEVFFECSKRWPERRSAVCHARALRLCTTHRPSPRDSGQSSACPWRRIITRRVSRQESRGPSGGLYPALWFAARGEYSRSLSQDESPKTN